MKLKLLISAAMAAMFAAAAPAWAHHGDWRDYGYYKHWKHGGDWHDRGYRNHWRGHRAHHERVYVREYVRTVPVYQPVYQSNPAPAPGIHVVVPDIYVPFPR